MITNEQLSSIDEAQLGNDVLPGVWVIKRAVDSAQDYLLRCGTADHIISLSVILAMADFFGEHRKDFAHFVWRVTDEELVNLRRRLAALEKDAKEMIANMHSTPESKQ